MKTAERGRLLAGIARCVPQLVHHGRMAIVEPRNRILRGIYLEDSSDPNRCYAWVFVQPLFEPPPFVVSFYLGRRLAAPSRTWSSADGDALVAAVLNEGPAFWEAAASPERLAEWVLVRDGVDPYAQRAHALALLACRRWPEATGKLRHLAEVLAGRAGWMAEMRAQCEALRQLAEAEPETALEELGRWEDENTRRLRLPHE